MKKIKQDQYHDFIFPALGSEANYLHIAPDALDSLTAFDQQEKREHLTEQLQQARKSLFEIADSVKEYRGIKKLEEDLQEDRFNEEITLRLDKLKDEALHKAQAQGREEGKEKAYQELKEKGNEEILSFNKLLQDISASYAAIVEKQEREIMHLIKHLVKWIVLKEIDDSYVGRLLEQLIKELRVKSNITIQVHHDDLAKMPTLLAQVEEVVGKLSNVRIEEYVRAEEKGLTIKTDNGIINGNLSEQFKILDKIFENVG